MTCEVGGGDGPGPPLLGGTLAMLCEGPLGGTTEQCVAKAPWVARLNCALQGPSDDTHIMQGPPAGGHQERASCAGRLQYF